MRASYRAAGYTTGMRRRAGILNLLLILTLSAGQTPWLSPAPRAAAADLRIDRSDADASQPVLVSRPSAGKLPWADRRGPAAPPPADLSPARPSGQGTYTPTPHVLRLAAPPGGGLLALHCLLQS